MFIGQGLNHVTEFVESVDNSEGYPPASQLPYVMARLLPVTIMMFFCNRLKQGNHTRLRVNEAQKVYSLQRWLRAATGRILQCLSPIRPSLCKRTRIPQQPASKICQHVHRWETSFSNHYFVCLLLTFGVNLNCCCPYYRWGILASDRASDWDFLFGYSFL